MSSTSTPADPIVKRLQTVQHLIDSGKLSEAAERLQGVAKSAPLDPRVYLIGMRLADAAGQPKRAEDAVRRAVQLQPEWPVAITELALLLARQNRFEEAIGQAQKAMALDGDNPDVLGRVIEVAHRTQHLELAKQWLRRASAIAPDNSKIKRYLAQDLRATGEREEALAIYDALLQAKPDDTEALLGRAQTLLDLGRNERALADTTALLALHGPNDVLQYWHELAQGRVPARQPLAMVQQLFDGMADLYDQHVVAGLKYTLPRDVAARIRTLYPDSLNVLDLGCGTGLLGASLGRIQGAMIGVELSPRMVEQAAKHGVYDRFHTVDLMEALEATPAGLYDVIAALDVFIYVGDIASAVPNALRVLRDGGHFIFSCETAGEDEADLVLRPTQRYAHKASAIEALCRAAGFAQVSVEAMPLRYEGNEPVQGFLVIAKKPA
ncbi:MAG: SAM-dependent methyltransferase [Ramlibacter sp.]|jgi:predicted TPR repeat methyltransferase|nr:SAM-dependent methyltransferase [Ramlibacter sp.]